MWYDEAVIYQIYPLGLCGAPAENDGVQAHRILRVADWAAHIRRLGATAVLFNPVFESGRHGYDVRDYRRIDCRLGTEEDFRKVCGALHGAGLRVLLDGVFNHVGRGFRAFQDVREKKRDSPFRDWFHIDFGGDSAYGDGFSYRCWEGCGDLVELALENPAVAECQFDAVRSWAEDYGIDGLRLDVAYCLDPEYIRRLRQFTDRLRPDFVLVGECVHGDYRRWMGPGLCHSVTNYECYKGLWSALNSLNLFEIGHSLQRQFGPEPWSLYRGAHLLSFLDNHDVDRIVSRLSDPRELPVAWGLLFAMPGVPAVYYGSEWGVAGRKADGDAALRPEIDRPSWTPLTDFIARLAAVRRGSRALCRGGYRNVLLTNRQIIFERSCEGERVLAAVNAGSVPFAARFDAGCRRAVDLITGESRDLSGGSELPPFSVQYWRTDPPADAEAGGAARPEGACG